jgi:signal transduction histidine kinase
MFIDMRHNKISKRRRRGVFIVLVIGGTVEIRVRDNGNGIPDEVREKIFEPFFTTKPTGSGTGLGLSLSYDIVTQGHGGMLSAESTKGEGATFVVTLPITR